MTAADRHLDEVPTHEDCPLCDGNRDGGPTCAQYHALVDLYAAISLSGQVYE